MIDNPLLYLLVDRLNALRRPGVSSDDSDLEHQHIDRMMAERAPGDARWSDHALNAYLRLARLDLADIPARTHHWFVEQLATSGGWHDARPGLFVDLFDLLDPVGRFLTVRTLTRFSGESGWDELAHIVQHLAETDDAIRDRRAREFADLLLDVWLSEGFAYDVREGGEREGRAVAEWFRLTIRVAQGYPGIREQVRAALLERAETLDQRTAAALRAIV